MLVVGQVRVPGMGSCSVGGPEQLCRVWGFLYAGGQQSWGLLAAWNRNSLLGLVKNLLWEGCGISRSLQGFAEPGVQGFGG